MVLLTLECEGLMDARSADIMQHRKCIEEISYHLTRQTMITLKIS